MFTLHTFLQEQARLQAIIAKGPNDNPSAYQEAQGKCAALNQAVKVIGKLYLGIEAAITRNDNSTHESIGSQLAANKVLEHFEQQGIAARLIQLTASETPVPFGSIEISW